MFIARFGLAFILFALVEGCVATIGTLAGLAFDVNDWGETNNPLVPLVSVFLSLWLTTRMEYRWHSADKLMDALNARWFWFPSCRAFFGFLGILALIVGAMNILIPFAHHIGIVTQCSSSSYQSAGRSSSSWSIPCSLDVYVFTVLLGASAVMNPWNKSSFWRAKAEAAVV